MRGSRLTLAVSGLLALVASPRLLAQPDAQPTFHEWLAAVREEAVSRGIRPEVVDEALADVREPLPVVVERDRTQAEVVLPLETYLERRVTPRLVGQAREMLARHEPLLDRIAAAYGVPARTIVAIWGLESDFGRFTGIRPTIAALATLAWDPRRATLFRRELFDALEILNRGDIELASLRGSWAGAMGQPQFMPSSYLGFAVDFDGDRRRDIWHSTPDVFASIANYLKGHGWVSDERWGREVSFGPDAAAAIRSGIEQREGACQAKRRMTVAKPLGDWRALGVRTREGGPLPAADMHAALVSGATRHFLVYGNYDVLLAYNCAHPYAVSVGLLSDLMTGRGTGATRTRPKRRPRRPAR
jgi:membrane-bound lytic murein transglycosylase B